MATATVQEAQFLSLQGGSKSRPALHSFGILLQGGIEALCDRALQNPARTHPVPFAVGAFKGSCRRKMPKGTIRKSPNHISA